MKPRKVIKLEKLYKEIKILQDDDEVQRYYDKKESERKRKFVSEQLKKGNMVWCRLGNVVPEATPCKQLKCNFKKEEDDIINGISNAGCCFQVTTLSDTWFDAKFIDMDGNT